MEVLNKQVNCVRRNRSLLRNVKQPTHDRLDVATTNTRHGNPDVVATVRKTRANEKPNPIQVQQPNKISKRTKRNGHKQNLTKFKCKENVCDEPLVSNKPAACPGCDTDGETRSKEVSAIDILLAELRKSVRNADTCTLPYTDNRNSRASAVSDSHNDSANTCDTCSKDSLTNDSPCASHDSSRMTSTPNTDCKTRSCKRGKKSEMVRSAKRVRNGRSTARNWDRLTVAFDHNVDLDDCASDPPALPLVDECPSDRAEDPPLDIDSLNHNVHDHVVITTTTSPTPNGNDTDSDCEDLPVGLTPLKCDKLTKEAIVWLRVQKWPHLPAIVKHVYRKKKRITCILFSPKDQPAEPITVSYCNPNNVIPYFGPRKEELMKCGETLEGELRAYFDGCIKSLEDFLVQRAVGQLKDEWSFFSENSFDTLDDLVDSSDDADTDDTTQDDTDISVTVTPQVKAVPHSATQRTILRLQKMKERNKKLVEFLLCDTCKAYLKSILHGKERSGLHTTFVEGSVKQKLSIKHQGFGPIDDDEQMESIVMRYMEWMKELNTNPYLNIPNYILDVCVPEAIVLGLKKVKGYGKTKAWEMFHKGVRRTKHELLEMHNSMIRKAGSISPGAEATYRDREQEQLAALGLDFTG